MNSSMYKVVLTFNFCIFATIIVMASLMACSKQEYVNERVQIMSEQVTYYQDTRTNLCFAELGGDITNVECNKEVLESSFKFESKKPSWK